MAAPDEPDCTVIFLNEARLIARIPRARAAQLAAEGRFPGQLPPDGKRHRINKAVLLAYLRDAAFNGDAGDAA